MTIQNSEQEQNASQVDRHGTGEMKSGRTSSRFRDIQYSDESLTDMLPGWARGPHSLLRRLGNALRAFAAYVADRMTRRSPFSWRERNWRQSVANGVRNVPRRLAAILVGLVAVAVALTVASQSTILADLHLPRPAAADSKVSDPVVLHQDVAPIPTPEAPAYLVGVWSTTPNPPSSGSVEVYVRVSHNAKPVRHVSVSLEVKGGSSSTKLGPYYTNSYGLIKFTVGYSGLSSRSPILLVAHASVDGKTYTAELVLAN